MRDPVELQQVLETSAHEFDFFMLLRLLENSYPELPRIGTSLRPRDDSIRLVQNPEMKFHATAIDNFQPATDAHQARLAVHFFGLTGPNGALPLHLTEYARERIRNHNDPTFARFLDIFHHRMLSLFYRARAVSEPTTNLDRDDDDRFSRYIGSLVGIGTTALRSRDSVPDFAKLHFAGLLASANRPGSGLAAILRGFFEMPVRIEQYVGHWLHLPPSAQTRLGRTESTETLGRGIVIGSKVWDCQSKFRIVIGPLDLAQYRRMLPGGESLVRLLDWVRNYVGDALEWDVNLILKKEEIPALILGTCQLGWTTLMHGLPPQADADQLYLNPVAIKSRQPVGRES
jgi:type VI secretion system protein ImpH